MATIEKRTGKDGSTSYRVKVRKQGEPARTRTFRRLTDAKAWAASIETDISRGVHIPETDRTLSELIDRFLDDATLGADARNLTRRLTWWRKHMGQVALPRLTPARIIEARRELAKRKNRYGQPISGPTQNRYLAALSAACKYGWRELQWLPHNPVLSITKASESAGVVRYLSDDERKALFEACRESADPNILCFVTLALATGLRYSNIRFLTWEDVDLQARTVTVERTKNGEGRRVPLIASAAEVLQRHYDADPTGKGWVFKGWKDDTPADMEKVWRVVKDEAGLHDFRFHDLRHTVASYLTQNGAGLAQVADALGHKTLAMARRYSHQSAEHVRGTLESIADKLNGG